MRIKITFKTIDKKKTVNPIINTNLSDIYKYVRDIGMKLSLLNLNYKGVH